MYKIYRMFLIIDSSILHDTTTTEVVSIRGMCILSLLTSQRLGTDYRASRYKSEALCLWPQRCNTAKPTRYYNSLTVARHATVVVAVPSTVHYPANYKIKNIRMKFKSVNKLLTLIIQPTTNCLSTFLRNVFLLRGIFFYGTPFRKFFLRRTQTGTAIRNLFLASI
jgi:hypothetical protein